MNSSDSFWLKTWDIIAAFGVFAVIIGIIGEGAELLVKWVHKKKYKNLRNNWAPDTRWIVAFLIKRIRRIVLEVETFAFALVVLGLVVEYEGGQQSKQILDKNNARLNMEAEQLESTNIALSLEVEGLRSNNLVLESNVLALKLQIQETAAIANATRVFVSESNTTARLNEAQNTVAEAGKVAANVKNILTNSNLANLKVHEPDRTINPETEANLIGLLKPFTKDNPVRGSSIIVRGLKYNDPESWEYARNIADVLRKCGFDPVVPVVVHSSIEDPPEFSHLKIYGIVFECNTNHPPLDTVAIIKAFHLAGIAPLHVSNDTNLEPNRLFILILPKEE